MRDRLDGVQLFGRRCEIDRQPRTRRCGTSSAEFKSSVVDAVSTEGIGSLRGLFVFSQLV